MDQTRQRFSWIKYIVIAIFVMLTIELVHLGIAYKSIQTASNFATRYGVTGEFNPDYCEAECPRGSKNLRHARLQSIRDAAYQGFREYSEVTLMNTLQEDKLQIVICSDREGINFDRETSTCSPQEDVGDPGGMLYIDLNYLYQFGSSIGLNLGEIKLSSSTESRMECTKLGCGSVFSVQFTGNLPEWYVIEASAADGRQRFINCPQGSLIEAENPIFHLDQCTTTGVAFDRFDPAELDLAVTWSGGSISETIEPRYRLFRPNGFRCEPTCRLGEFVVDVQE